jgi:GMP synthase-like glutamine amidotransferase
VIKHAKACNAFTNPTTNSYKRLVPGYEAPVLLAYSSRNRSASCRIPHTSNPKAKRVEVRFPDPSANPYLAFAATIAGGLHGLENKIEPPGIFQGNAYEATDIPRVPTSLHEAIDVFETSEVAREAFGDFVFEHLLNTARQEQITFDNTTVTDWELIRYFERVSPEASVGAGIGGEVLDEQGVPWHLMQAWVEMRWPDPAEVAGLVLLGGDMNANELEAYPFLKEVRTFTLEVLRRGAPVLGICLGAQTLAILLGGNVERARRVELGFSTLEATPEGRDDPVLGDFAGGVEVFQWHEDTFSLPSSVTPLLIGDGMQQAFRSGVNCYGTQFHFEVTEDDVAAWLEATPPQRLRDHWGRSADELLAEVAVKLPAQQQVGREAFRRWAELLES